MVKTNRSKPTVISLISGKGGVGKTAVSGSLAYLLSGLGYRVLLIDCDLATYGLSYFFIDEIEKQNSSDLTSLIFDPQIIDLINLPKNIIIDEDEQNPFGYVRLGTQLWLLPSISHVTNNNSIQDDRELDFIKRKDIKFVLDKLVDKLDSVIDFVVLDSQAGFSQATAACVELSDIAITILEADPIGMWAVNSLERRLAEFYPRNLRTYYLVNKLFFDEVSQYKSITNYLRSISHLPPLPFDFEVRKSFARRKIPIDLKHPTAFLISLVRLVPDLIPQADEKAANLEKTLINIVVEPIKNKLAQIENEMKLVKKVLRMESKRQYLQRLFLAFIAFITVLVGVYGYLIKLQASSYIPFLISLFVILIFATLGGPAELTKMMNFLLVDNKKVDSTNDDYDSLGRDVLLKKMDDLLARRRYMESLLITKSDELLFPTIRQTTFDTNEKVP